MRSHLRREGKIDRELKRSRAFEYRNVLITGAGGSIGSTLCHRVVEENATRLVLVSLTESGLYNIEKSLRKHYGKYRDTIIVPVLGDYGDDKMMTEALRGIDVVVHAGAHKHVPICESNPISAIDNNVIGTMMLMNTAIHCNVSQFCAISSDKAVQPSSIMGATKKVVEQMCRTFNGRGKTRFFAVRFGNVMDSAGSVLPLWREQIASGGPITLTDERCERFFMSVDDAVTLIENVIHMKPIDGIFVLDMGKPVKLIDLAQRLMAQCGKSVQIETIGLRKGEKLKEELSYGGTLEPVADRINRVIESPAMTFNTVLMHQLVDACKHRNVNAALKALWEMVAR